MVRKKKSGRGNNSLLAQVKQTLAKEETFWGRVKSYYRNEPLMTRVGIDTSLLISVFFIVVNLWNGIANEAMWSIMLTGYYVLIDVINGLMLRNLRNKPSPKKERAEVRRVGYIMIGLDFLFLAMLAQMIVFDAKESYNLMIIIANSIYTVYRIVIAVYNMVRTRHLTSPTLVATKNIAMIAVLITATVLQASVVEYVSGDEKLVRVVNGAVGVVAFIVIFLLSGLLIRKYQE